MKKSDKNADKDDAKRAEKRFEKRAKNREKRIEKLIDKVIAKPGKKISLDDYDPAFVGDIENKKEADEALQFGVQELARQQDRLYAQNT